MRADLLPAVGLEHEALDDARKAVELDPGFWIGWADLGLLYARRHQHAEALRCAESAMAGAPWSPYSIGVMAAALANEGQADRAEPLLVTLRGDAYGGPVGLAVYFLARGEIEQAVEWSAKASRAIVLDIVPAYGPVRHTSSSARPGNREEYGALFKCVDVVRDALVERKQPARAKAERPPRGPQLNVT